MAQRKAPGDGDWFLCLRPEPQRPGEPGPVIRMRHVLKSLLRQYGFRCIRVSPDVPAELPPVSDEVNPEKTEPPF